MRSSFVVLVETKLMAKTDRESNKWLEVQNILNFQILAINSDNISYVVSYCLHANRHATSHLSGMQASISPIHDTFNDTEERRSVRQKLARLLFRFSAWDLVLKASWIERRRLKQMVNRIYGFRAKTFRNF